MRLRSVANWTLLCLNALLFLFLVAVSLLFVAWPRLDPAARLARKYARDISTAFNVEYEVYLAKDPFALLVPKHRPDPDTRWFTFFDSRECGLYLMVTPPDIEFGAATDSVLVGMGDDFAVSWDYSRTNGEANVDSVRLSRQSGALIEAFTDYKADGSYDVRQTRDEDRGVGCMYVWYDGAWQEIMDAQKDPNQKQFHKRLVTGQQVYFDDESGRWLPSPENPVQ